MPLYDDYDAMLKATAKKFLEDYEAARNKTEAELRARIKELESTPAPPTTPPVTPPVDPPVTPPTNSSNPLTAASVVTQWDGGSAYWDRFPKAKAAGWTDPNFFPISVFLSKSQDSHIVKLKEAGVNTFMGVEHNTLSNEGLAEITKAGMFAMTQTEWSSAEVGNNPSVVGWFASDECDMGLNGCGDTEAANIAKQRQFVANIKSKNDGRFVWANFGNGILRTFWSKTYMKDHVQLMDGSSADKYTYTSPDVAGIIDGWHDAPDWPNGVPVARAYSYGWQVDQMKRFQNQEKYTPIWTFVETAKPYLTENGAKSITPDQIEGAVWSALIHGARGIAYFQHNNDGRGNYSIVDIPAVNAKLKAVNGKVKSLAKVLNSPSRYNTERTVNGFKYQEWTFNNGTDTMLKVVDGYAYIFAGLGMKHTTGSKTFQLPAGSVTGSVEVVGENRTINLSNNSFSDSFAAEYSHHVYKIKLA